MLKNNFFTKLAVIVLVFSFVTSSLPVNAQEVINGLSSDSTVIQTQPVDSTPVADPSAQTPTEASSSPTTTQDVSVPAALEGKGLDLNSASLSLLTLTEELPPPDTYQPITAAKNFADSNQKSPDIDLSDGALIYNFKIEVPPGRNGVQPDLKLQYNSQNTLKNNILGYGWTTNIPYIQRVNKDGSNNLYTSSNFSSSLSGDLVNTSGSSYIAKVEKGDFLKYTYSSDIWTVKDKSGTVYTFGSTASTRQDDPNNSSHIYKWMLEKVLDTNGNYITYTYYKDSGQIYPSTITYTNNGTETGPFSVAFSRESRTDVKKDSSPAFVVTTSYRLSQILISISGTWTRKYDLDYSYQNGHSLLTSITESGQDESSNTTTLPALSFEYTDTASTPGWTYNSSWTLPTEFFNGSTVNGDLGVRIGDINGDGLPDIVRNSEISGTNSVGQVWFNDGDGTWTQGGSSWYFPVRQDDANKREAFSTSSGVDTGLRLFDINGDGLNDLVKGADSNKKYVYLNTGSGWTYNSSWTVPTYFHDDSITSKDIGVRIGDVNGDGLPDIVCHSELSSGECGTDWAPGHIWLNDGDGTWTDVGGVSGTWSFPYNEADSSTPRKKEAFSTSTGLDSGLRLVDVNGDGLEDLIKGKDALTGNGGYVYLNNGVSGWTYDSSWSQAAYFLDSGDLGARFGDINGDGFYDITCRTEKDSVSCGTPSVDPGRFWINDGKTFTEVGGINGPWTFPYKQDDTSNKEAFSTSYLGDTGLRMADINADGQDDLLRKNPDNQSDGYVYLNNTQTSANLLKKITFPEGGSYSMSYKPVAQYSGSNNKVPFVVQTLNQMTINDGLDNTSTITYSYENGIYYYDSSDVTTRKFAGFGKITETDGAGNVTKMYFHQGDSSDSTHGEYSDDYWKIGELYRTEKYDGSSNLYSKQINKWDEYDLGSGAKFVKLAQTVNSIYDGNTSHKDVALGYTYDNTYGNMTQKVNYGEVTGSDDGTFSDTGSDKSTEDISYVTNTTDYIVGLPYQDTVTDQSTNKVKETKTYYDGQSLGSVTDGNVTKIEDWKESSTYINTQKTYNTTYGIVTSVTDPRGKTTSYSYDSFYLYPATVTDPLSHTTQYLYDYSLGKPKQTTDQNSFVYQTTYDGLDRVTAEKVPDFSSPYSAITKTAYAYTDTSGAVSIHKTDYLDASTSIDSYQYFDGLSRLIQEREEAESSGSFNVKDTVYDVRSMVQKQSLPYTSSGSSKTSATGTTSLYINYTYDALKRPYIVVDATGTTTYTYDDWKTTINDVNSKNKYYYQDARNNLIKVEEINGANTYTTNYEWNLNGKLTKITDALSNIRNFTYDGLGRRLTAEDLHASADGTYGTWTYTYDNAGNLTESVSPRSKTIDYTYNDVNQILTEDYTGDTGTEISYTYSGCTNGTGKLCSISMTSGANTSYTYDSNSNVASEVKTINSNSYTTSFTYDRLGNKLVITYPDNAEVRYTYNTAGLLNQIERKESGGVFTDVISNFDYSPANQVTTETYPNNITTTNTYNSAQLYRLTKIQTTSTASSSSNNNPVITLTGANLIDLSVGDTWTDPGYSATDTEDGNLTASVTVTGSVNTGTAGTYQLVYSVEDSGGLPAERKIRTVVVHGSTNSLAVKALVVGGGGGGTSSSGGGCKGGGAGGAGQLQYNASFAIIPQSYSVTVGGGGAHSDYGYRGISGGSSSFSTITSIGGGGGGGQYQGPSQGAYGAGYGGCSTGTGSSGLIAYKGGDAYYETAGGGGGSNGNGGNGNGSSAGNGGAGTSNSISGTSVTYAGGGGGGANAGRTAGTGYGGGGNGSNNTAVRGGDGVANTGGGGGGGPAQNSTGGGNGGSGIVIISYPSDGSTGVSDSSTGGTITTSGGNRIHTFSSSGTFVAVASSPVISLTGQNLISMNVGDTWVEPGYSATDPEDGNLTASVTVTGSVNTGTAGTYQLVYSVEDSTNLPAERKVRTVYVHAPSSSDYQNINYTYDNVGNVTQIIESSNTSVAKTANYVYDDLYRLTSATITNVASGQSTYTHTFTYDAIGNISTGPIGSYTYAGTGYANPHAATSINSVTYSYDNDGNVTGNGTLSNTWNYKDQLAQAVVGSVTSDYLYDQDGNRVSLANGTTTTVYPNRYYNTDGTKQTKQVYDNSGNLIATVETASSTVTPYYDHVDHLGSVTAVSDDSGALAETLDYYPYGNQRISSGSYTGQRQYVGQLYDADTALDYLNARYYEGVIGRFISQDPVFLGDPSSQSLKNPQALNSYSYANNNPITFSDPNGKCVEDLCIGEALIITSPQWAPLIAAGVTTAAASLYYGAKELLESTSWGSHYGGQVQMINPSKYGFGVPPMGPEDMIPNLKPDLPQWAKIAVGLTIGGVLITDRYSKRKETSDSAKEFKNQSASTINKQTSISSTNDTIITSSQNTQTVDITRQSQKASTSLQSNGSIFTRAVSQMIKLFKK